MATLGYGTGVTLTRPKVPALTKVASPRDLPCRTNPAKVKLKLSPTGLNAPEKVPCFEFREALNWFGFPEGVDGNTTVLLE